MSAIHKLSTSPLALGMGSLLLGTAFWFAPPTLVARVRGAVLDGLRPGMNWSNRGKSATLACLSAWQSAELRDLQQRLDSALDAAAQSDARLQQVIARKALQAEQPPQVDPATTTARGSPPLFLPAIVEARVIGETLGRHWRSGAVLDEGWQTGIRETALVLKSPRPLIDLGAPDQLTVEDPLLIGNAVIGKIEVVGHWTSTFLPITDPDYRGAAQLVRVSDAGSAWGAKGILRGSHENCVLEGIPIDATVRVGDAVFTAGRDGALEAPLYYGAVESAQLGPNDREWQITVKPAALPSTITHVRVLRAALNPQRLWAH
ncbi:MAG: hypothetical protein B7Z55_09985 [Planctomycetales bacterium 12-60-4]|nr:MAG: hypothetical protein B7Z55_09985 [Planctomycetales bacterium 12-60-4]